MFNLSPEQVAVLERLAKQESGPQQRRAQIVMLAGQGKSPREIGGEVQLTDQQVRHWLREFRERGLEIFPKDAIETLSQQPAIPDEKQSKVQKTESPGVKPDDPMPDAGRKVLAHYFARMRGEEEGVRQGEDSDPVHDMRVATRRLRNALTVFGPYYKKKAVKALRKPLSDLANVLGDVRDLDVLRHKAHKYVEKLPEDQQKKLDPLLDDWKNKLAHDRETLIQTLDSPMYTEFVADFEAFVTTLDDEAQMLDETPYRVRHVLPTLVYERYETVRAYETILSVAPLDTLHALRIEAKHLRYTLEAFEEVLGSEVRRVIDEIKALQDHLGDLQDTRVASALIHDYITQAEDHEPMTGILEYLMAREEEKQSLLAGVAQRWQAFVEPEVRRALALSVSVL